MVAVEREIAGPAHASCQAPDGPWQAASPFVILRWRPKAALEGWRPLPASSFEARAARSHLRMTLSKKREAAVSGGLRYRGVPHWLGRLLSRSLRTPFSEGRGNSGTAASRAYRDKDTDPSHFHDATTLRPDFPERQWRIKGGCGVWG